MSDKPTRTPANVMIDALLGVGPQLPDFDAILQQVERVAKAIDSRLIVEAGPGGDHHHAGAAKGINVFVGAQHLKHFEVCIRLSDNGKTWVGELALDDDTIRRAILDQITWRFTHEISR